ncbi:beta-D-glucuronidase [Streptococcus equi subsp. zooepidemicus SzS31A1]|uniref:Beta-glucuronidase n=1 Tax=Streptococcus equi subsp. zooepidemicus SzS31A1 TaxID=1352602 RepID=A0ABP2XD80_STRSZ|nr:beta-glucuronidase [Streptococcus equi]HEL0664508.1 beta-glucuronidase [Streptococcus equi subsp. zooepidemicus]EQB23962.1 beta-D-glucuronidase [Streptococcus equi subsp. zooepidemicus SzS31A1]HEL0688153.1 beta-glucuronidase [Streptococcus equi subsp. zooepidemicus]HEL0750930.1 beta-glucuronidase [Streptococcus equi subsp. zooepidemicus]HEL0773757.1 beta-glucuronidase [Streptococcus equi subsp. zooepidemicus]
MLYPILTKTRKIYDLGGLWQFKLGDHNPQELLASDELMVVPTSFNDVVVDKDKRNYIGDFWYERFVDVPDLAADEELVLRFGSVTHNATVYVNGQALGQHKGGFTPFEVLVPETHYQDNQIKVSVCANNILDYTSLPVGNYSEETQEDGSIKKIVKENFDFFNYAGIHRPVKLMVRPKCHISDITITSDLSEDMTSALVEVSVETSAAVDEVKVTIFDEEHKLVVQAIDGKARLDKVRLWEVLDAYLYTAHVEIIVDGNVVDSYDEPFGIRSIAVEKGQFLLNGKPVYFKGFGKHEDTFINGRGLNEAANLMDMNLLKELGANSFRTSHYPYSEEMMRLADRMGILVIDEVPAVGLFQNFTASLDLSPKDNGTWSVMKTKEAHEQAIRELVKRDKNHPSVVMWVVANEPASHEEGAHEYFEPLIALYKALDPQQRPVTLVNLLLATPDRDKVMDLVDVISLNRYYAWYVDHGDLTKGEVGLRQELLEWQSKFPEKPILMTEYGADTLPGLHSMWDIPYTEEFQCRFYEMSHRVFDEIPNLVGEQVWNFADFETNLMIFRIQGNHKGLFSRNRQPKHVVGLFKERWNTIPHYNYKKK